MIDTDTLETLEENDNFTTIVLSEKSFTITTDTWDFAVKLSTIYLTYRFIPRYSSSLVKNTQREKQSGDGFVKINRSTRSFLKMLY